LAQSRYAFSIAGVAIAEIVFEIRAVYRSSATGRTALEELREGRIGRRTFGWSARNLLMISVPRTHQ
jgi:hypothetical protein